MPWLMGSMGASMGQLWAGAWFSACWRGLLGAAAPIKLYILTHSL